MREIKVEFYRTENFVYGRVLEMPEELRGKDIISNGTYGIFSNEGPGLDGKCLYLKGEHKYCDNEWFACTYCDSDTAERAIQSFQSLLEEWNEKHREILTEKERSYLSAVIKPFKNRILCIKKKEMTSDSEYIYIRIKSAHEYDRYAVLEFPLFKKGQMYKGMETNREYILKELKLE